MTDQQLLNLTSAISIMLVENHQIMREGIKSLLEKQEDIKIIGETFNEEGLVHLLSSEAVPDLIITAINNSIVGDSGFIERIIKYSRGAKILALSMIDDEVFIIDMLKAGVTGFVLKSTTADELLFAVRHIAAGNKYICSELTTKLINRLIDQPVASAPVEFVDVDFSARELEILTLLGEGYTNQEIAEKLFTSRRTIEGYRENMIAKAGVPNTVALIKYAAIRRIIT